MRFQLFVFNVLCLCYVISADSKVYIPQNKLEQNRTKRTIILTSVIKKFLWRKFSNFINLPITRRPYNDIYFTTERIKNRLSTKNSLTSTSVFENSGSLGSSVSKDNYGPTVSSSTKQNDDLNSVKLPFSGSGHYTDRPKSPGNQGYTDYQQIPAVEQNYESASKGNSGVPLFSGPGGYKDGFNGPQRQENNNYEQSSTPAIVNNKQPISAPDAQHYGPTGPISAPGGQDYGPTGPISAPDAQNYGPTGPISAPDAQNYGPTGPISAPDAQNFGPTGSKYFDSPVYNAKRKQEPEPTLVQSAQQNFKQPNTADKQSFESVTDHPNNRNQQQHKNFQSIDYSFNQNKPFQYDGSKSPENNEYYNSQAQPKIQNLANSPFPQQHNSQFDNLRQQIQSQNDEHKSETSYANVEPGNNENFNQGRNPISQPNPTSTPFLINYPHHQHYQQLIPNINQLNVPQNNYQPIYNHNQDSSNFNEFNRPVLNYYSPEDQYY